jgi:effector-binding domain-containing protein
MKALKYIILLLLILVIGFSIFIAVQPNSFKVSRSKIIKAPQSVIYNNIIDFKNWEAWSAWVENDPEMTLTLGDNSEGIGGSYSWKDKSGMGTMETIDAIPNTFISQEMQVADYPKSDVNWTLEPIDNSSTKVTWEITGKNLPFGFKMASVLMGGMEKQIGPYFERSLIKLDSLLQAEMKVYTITVEGVTQHSGGYYLYSSTSCKYNELEKNRQDMLPQIGAYALTHNVTKAGPPFLLYHKRDKENDAVIFSSAVPTNSKIITEEDSHILTGQLESFKAIKTVLRGNYDNLEEAWKTTMNYIADQNLEVNDSGPMLETYVTDPIEQPNPAKWITEIYIAIK